MTGPELQALGRDALGRGWGKALARSLGVSQVTVSRWANGHQAISPAMAIAILCVLNHDMAEIDI